MVTIDYSFEDRPDPVGWEHAHDPRTASRADILWYFFPGDIRIRVDDVEYATDFGWVPLVHFALALTKIAEDLTLNASQTASYGFTESDDSILFVRDGEMVDISWTLGSPMISCRLDRFAEAVGEFAQRLVFDIDSVYPGFVHSSVSVEMLRRASAL